MFSATKANLCPSYRAGRRFKNRLVVSLRLCVRFVFAKELTHAKALEAQRKR
jgi:hypothetical protein